MRSDSESESAIERKTEQKERELVQAGGELP